MQNNNYPGLLNKKARVLLSLNRQDLVFSGSVFLILSLLKLNGAVSLMVNLALLIGFKILSSRLSRGFFSLLNRRTLFKWQILKEEK